MDCCVHMLIIWIWWLCHEPRGRRRSCSPSCDRCPLRKVALHITLLFYFIFYYLIQWQEVHCVIYSSINRGCNKNLKSHHTTDDHLHMKNKATECQEGKVGGCKFQQLLGRSVCDDIWTHTHTHTHRSTNSPLQCRLYLEG